MSRFFRRPDDSDSESSSSASDFETPGRDAVSETPHRIPQRSKHRGPSAEDDSEPSEIQRSDASSTRDQTLSADGSVARTTQNAGLQANANASQHQEMLLATLLEEHYRTRAAEFLNTANPGSNYTRHSPEVQPLARQLFTQASTMLESAGILNNVTSSSDDALRDTRAQYLAGLDQLGAGLDQASANDLLASMTQLNLQPPPTTTTLATYIPKPRSHYQSSFREVCLLGRGGFGRVFKCHNLLDQKTYAVKKIPLSPHLSKSFAEGRHEDLQHILVEVQTLASLDHANIVRYHATWVEEPQAGSPTAGTSSMGQGFAPGRPATRRKLLLENTNDDTSDSLFLPPEPAQQMSCGFVFAEDSESLPGRNEQKLLTHDDTEPIEDEQSFSEEPSADASDIFTDGTRSQLPLIERQHKPDEESHHARELYIQMSLYPMTLFHYLSPATSTDTSHPRHCYHLLPSLQIFLSILQGLRYLWSRRLVHRDVKPRNIFLSEPEPEPLTGYCDASCRHACHGHQPRWLNPRIGDFGLVTQLAHGELPEVKGSSKVVGTPLYRPPACAWAGDSDRDGEAETEKVDIFALGVVFVELLCPFSTAMERATALSGLQKGVMPDCLRERLEREGFGEEVVDRVLEMTAGMVDPYPGSRWSGEKIAEAVQDIKTAIEVTWSTEQQQ
ncbi:kinase-like domain-containing protein [Podospora aff. communis PSN243]|uniref:Kinase-like domain-containing protein n=1 Tax=Podospora aff. communis PSN243 TaxID=3040156 RepID=A0AAV9GMF3_9PEZI|nr:kinase-like domain-containing protein [Podospora aff. communis PSN243]